MFYVKVVFRKIADLKRERELAETRKNEGLDQISSDHPVRKLISKFRKISQENRAASQGSTTSVPPPTTSTSNSSQSQQQQQPSITLPLIPETIIQPASAEPTDSSPTANASSSSSSAQHLQLPHSTTIKQRDKLETISERIESQESQVSQITSVNQSPPLQRPPKSSKWKWLKSGSTEHEKTSSKPPSAPHPQQQTTNPFDPNLSDDETQSKSISNNNEQKPSIPLSLFIPRAARNGSIKTSEDETDDQVIYF